MSSDSRELPPLFAWRRGLLSPAGPANPTTRFVLLALSQYADMSGYGAFPSQERLALDCGLSRRAVQTHLALGEALSWIRRRKKGSWWRGGTNYDLIIGAGSAPNKAAIGERSAPMNSARRAVNGARRAINSALPAPDDSTTLQELKAQAGAALTRERAPAAPKKIRLRSSQAVAAAPSPTLVLETVRFAPRLEPPRKVTRDEDAAYEDRGRGD